MLPACGEMSNLNRSDTRIGLKPLRLPIQYCTDRGVTDRDATSRPTKIRKRETYPDQIKIESRPAYHEFMTLDQGGFAVIASDNTQNCSLVAIKKKKTSIDLGTNHKHPVYHDNIVNLLNIFKVDDTAHMIYQQMDISLRMINGIPHHLWKDHEIAAVCKEESPVSLYFDNSMLINHYDVQVLNGVLFMHQELTLYHGDINCGTILMNREGSIKIGTFI